MKCSLSSPNLVRQAYLLGLLLLAVGLTLSPFLMGLSQFWLVGVWIADGIVNRDFKQKWQAFSHNWVAVLLVSLYLMHLVGFGYSSDIQYALKDLRIKMPLLLLPFVLSSMQPLSKKQFDLLLYVYVCSVLIATFRSFSLYVKHEYNDIREIALHISHIRLCLNIVFCVFITGYYLFKRQMPWWERALQIGVMAWLCYIIYIFESLSGYAALCAGVGVTLLFCVFSWKKSLGFRIGVVAAFLIFALCAAFGAYRILKPWLEVEKVDVATLDKKTSQGNDYVHDTTYFLIEDGRYCGLYYCEKELEATWPLRSDRDVNGETTNGESLWATLVRYLTSKGLRKDAEGVMALTDEDVVNIENGVANYNNYIHPGVRARISSTLFEYNRYRRTNNPNGGSLSQRIEYTRASFHIIGQHPWFGVGTGDVPEAYRQAYDALDSPLQEEFRHRAHNQYLAIAAGFGIVGLLLFLVVLLLPYLAQKRNRTYLYTIFLCIILLSMFPEDTIETQAGVSLFAFFNALFLLAKPREEKLAE